MIRWEDDLGREPQAAPEAKASMARDLESVLGARYWLTDKGWAATERARIDAERPDLERDGYAWPALGGA